MAKLLSTIINGDLRVTTNGTDNLGLIHGDGQNIKNVNWTNLINKPNTIGGYQITDAFTKTEINAILTDAFDKLIMGMDWKESVNTLADITTTYGPGPGKTPVDGWTVNVKDTDITYRFDGTKWIEISANTIPMASATIDGKMSKEHFVKVRDIQAGAEVNQNAYSSIKLGATTTAATSKQDTFEFANGLNMNSVLSGKVMTISHSTMNTSASAKSANTTMNIIDSISVSNGHVSGSTYKTIATDNDTMTIANTGGTMTITHKLDNGHKHIPAGGASNQWLKWNSLGTAQWEALPLSSTSLVGIVQLNNTATSTSITQAATAAIAKSLQDQINNLSGGGGGSSAYVRKTGDEMTGKLTFAATNDLGVYHSGGGTAHGMIRRGLSNYTTVIGNVTGATTIESSVNPKVKVGAGAETDIFHMGRKADISKGETVGVLPITQGGTGQSTFVAPVNSGDGFMRYDGTKFTTVKISFDDIGGGTGGSGGSGSDTLDSVYLRRDGAFPMTGPLTGTTATMTGKVIAANFETVGNVKTASIDASSYLKVGGNTTLTGTLAVTGVSNFSSTITSGNSRSGSITSNGTITSAGIISTTANEININGIRLIKNATDGSLDFVF